MKLHRLALAVAAACTAPAALALTPAQIDGNTVRLWISGASAPTAAVYQGVLTLCRGMTYLDAQGTLHTNPGARDVHLYLESATAGRLPGTSGDRNAYTCTVQTDDGRAGSLEGRRVVVFHTVEGGSFNYVAPHISIAGDDLDRNGTVAQGDFNPVSNANLPGQLRRTANIEGLSAGGQCAAGAAEAVNVTISGQVNPIAVYRGCATFNQVFTAGQVLRPSVTQNPDRPEGGFSDTEYMINQVLLGISTDISAIGGEVPTNIGQVFGPAVSYPLYFQLQQKDIANGLIPANCDDAPASVTAPNLTAECQPNLPAPHYTTPANAATIGGVTPQIYGLPPSATAFPGTSGKLQFHRRAITSGTQSTSNIRFLNNPCALGKVGGALAPSRVANSTALVTVFENSSTGGVRTGLNNAAAAGEFGLGWLSMENIPSATDRWAIVKLDGVSPNFDGLNADAFQRQTAMDGRYSAFYELVAFTAITAFAEGTDLIAAVNGSLGNPGITNLPGLFITPLAGVTGSNVGLVYRDGNSCRPAAK